MTTATELVTIQAGHSRARIAHEHVDRPRPEAVQQRVAGQGQLGEGVQQRQRPDLLRERQEKSREDQVVANVDAGRLAQY